MTNQAIFRNTIVGFGVGVLANAALAAAIVTSSYNLGTSQSTGSTSVPGTACFDNNPGSDALLFTDSGNNRIGIHTYDCNYGFGSRSSGENNYYVDGKVAINETFVGNSFGYFIEQGDIGAFGSTLFGAGNIQYAELTINFSLDGMVIIDQSWMVSVGQGGVVTATTTSNGSSTVGSSYSGGSGFGSYSIFGDSGFISLGLNSASHTVLYTITSKAFGSVDTSTAAASDCYAASQPGGGGGANALAAADGHVALASVAAASGFNGVQNVFCGAGARIGDPFSLGVARVFTGLLPDSPAPLPAPLVLLAVGLVGLGVRRVTR
jgi:hypothetical protein